MGRKILFFLWITASSFPVSTSASERSSIEIFSIADAEVIFFAEKNESIQKEMEALLASVHDVVKKVQPIPSKGIILKIPLEPSVMIVNEWMEDLVDETFIFFPEEKDEPFLLIFDQENRSHFFQIKRDAIYLFLQVIKNIQEEGVE